MSVNLARSLRSARSCRLSRHAGGCRRRPRSNNHHNFLNHRPQSSLFSSSVSQDEVSKFSAFSKTWWDPKENPLVGMNPIRMKFITETLQQQSHQNDASSNTTDGVSSSSTVLPLQGLKALDVGCGGGLLSESLARLGASSVTAIDPSTELVAQAKAHAQLDPKTRSIDYRGGWTVEQLASEYTAEGRERNQELFDVICLLEVIEHVTDVDSVLNAVKQLLAPKGTLFVSTMSKTFKSHAVAIVGAEYVMRYLPPGTHDWNQFKSPQDVEALMQQVDMEQVQVNGMVLTSPPMFGKWNWALHPTDTDINWIGAYRHKKKMI